MHKKGEREREKSLTLQIFLKWYLRESQVSSIKPPLSSSLLFDKETFSQAEQKRIEPAPAVGGRFMLGGACSSEDKETGVPLQPGVPPALLRYFPRAGGGGN